MSQVGKLTGDDRIVGVVFAFMGPFDDCREKVIRQVDKVFMTEDSIWTVEVDVVAVSMGGLVARYAAAPAAKVDRGRRLRIKRLFTISTPHLGSNMARLPTFDRWQIGMRSGSSFLRILAAELKHATYTIHPDVRLEYLMVGPLNATSVDQAPSCVPSRFFGAHLTAFKYP